MRRAVGLFVLVFCCAGASRPADFDAFWDARIKELSAVPINAQIERGESEKQGVDYWKITLDNTNGTKVRGQLARPSGEAGKLAALLIPQWAGVYPLKKEWAVSRAADGWIVLNILAHDLPIDEPEDFYKKQFDGPLKDYWSIGNDDPSTSYFMRMFLACYRAADYLAQRPDWDGKTLAVGGASQGGWQALATAALHPKIVAATANVPAGCDLAIGWPQWHGRTQGKDADKVRKAADYYDVIHFAPRIKVPVLVSHAAKDDLCPPAGIVEAMEHVTSPKEIMDLGDADHYGTNNSHQKYFNRQHEWLEALHGKKVPPS